MGVTVQLKNAENPMLALGQAAGCAGWADQLHHASCLLMLKPKALQIMRHGELVAQTNINTPALQFLIEGKLSAYSASSLKERVSDLYKEAVKKLSAAGVLVYSESFKNETAPSGGGIGVYPPPSDEDVMAVLTDPTPNKAAKPKKIKPPVSLTELVSSDSDVAVGEETKAALGDKKVVLSKATALHQPVSASSAGSTYHVVALGDGIAMAARIKLSGDGWSLSVRLEGTKYSAYKAALEKADIDLKDGYASQHLTGNGGGQMARRALGAMLYATQVPFQKISTDPSAIINKGA